MGSMGSIESVAAVAADNFSLDKVEAARGAAAAAVLLSGGTRPQQHVPNGSESTVRGATAATPDSILLNNNNGGSNGEDSIVISSPSVGHSRECENSSAMSHPHSPGSFLLDVSILTKRQNLACWSHTRPSLYLIHISFSPVHLLIFYNV